MGTTLVMGSHVLEKTVQIASNWKTVISACLLVIASLVWAADTRYQTHDKATQMQVEQIRDQIADLEIQKGYAESGKERQMFEARIAVKENRIKQIQGK